VGASPREVGASPREVGASPRELGTKKMIEVSEVCCETASFYRNAFTITGRQASLQAQAPLKRRDDGMDGMACGACAAADRFKASWGRKWHRLLIFKFVKYLKCYRFAIAVLE
jgi:hypothetical protein